MEYNFDKRQEETNFKHLVRVSVDKINKLHNKDWTDIKEEFKFEHSSDHLRKLAQGWKMLDDHEESEVMTESKEDVRYKETTEILGDGSYRSDKLISMSDEDSKDAKYLLEVHGFNPDEWEITNARNSMWNANSKKNGLQTLFSSKITVKPKLKELDLKAITSGIKDIVEGYKRESYTPTRYSSDGKLLELNVSDLHLNKMGYKNGIYDSKMAEEAFFHIINDVLTRTENIVFEKILFIWSHDFFNVDGMGNTTTAGTPQDVTMRYTDMYKKGMEMLVKGIEMISEIAPVETIQVGANHDKLTSYTMSEVLYAWFRNDENVTIDNDPISRKYRKFGKCLIGFSHGNNEKKRLGKIMPVEARKEWGETYYAEIHAGHLHSEQAIKEENGVIVRHLSSPSGTDNWHFDSGYVGAIPKAQSFIWDKDLGLTDILHTPIISSYESLSKDV